MINTNTMYETANIVTRLRRNSGHSLRELARRAQTNAASLVDYEAGRHEAKISTLRRLAEAAGCDLVVEVRPRLTAPEQRSLALHQAVAAHLRTDPKKNIAIAQRNLLVMRESDVESHAAPYLDTWQTLLSGPLHTLLSVLTSTDQPARSLRQASPFGGVLSDAERLAIISSRDDYEVPHYPHDLDLSALPTPSSLASSL
jgi:transcriptional regulator with XRE-family HTH domain